MPQGYNIVHKCVCCNNVLSRVSCFYPVPACEKAWIYERVPGYELAGYNDRTVSGVGSRLACQELCLRERALPCRSAEYNYETDACVLSRETRRTQPAAYRSAM